MGIAGAAIASLYVDRTKKFEELAKSCFAMSSVCLIAFTLVSLEILVFYIFEKILFVHWKSIKLVIK